MIITLFKKLPPSVSVPAFYCYSTILLIFHFLFASTYGALVLALSVYVYVITCTSINPLTPIGIVSWVTSLSSEYKIALLSSFVTVAGFVVAFHTATINWRSQMRAQLKSQAAGDIESFFTMVSSNISTASLYIESLIRTVNEIQDGTPTTDASFSIAYHQEKVEEFIAARSTLSQASIEVHRLIGRNHNLLSTGWGLIADINQAAESLSRITKKMWVHIPIVNLDDPGHVESFVDQVNATKYNEFLEVCNVHDGIISGLSGGVQGHLTAPIWGFSFTMFVNLIMNRKEFKESIRELHKNLNNDNQKK